MAQYLVRKGDYPMKIARDFGISFEQFSAMNPGLCVGDQCRVLYVGEILNVPDRPVAVAPVVQPSYQPVGAFAGSPPWMEVAKGELGQHEWAVGDNPRILQYLASVGLSGPDEKSWCGAFVNWCLRVSGSPSANTGLASAWVNWGRAVRPVYGAITVLKPLAAGASGHVGFLHAIVGNQVWLLSGNSANSVRLAPYDRSKLYNATPFRWPG